MLLTGRSQLQKDVKGLDILQKVSMVAGLILVALGASIATICLPAGLTMAAAGLSLVGFSTCLLQRKEKYDTQLATNATELNRISRLSDILKKPERLKEFDIRVTKSEKEMTAFEDLLSVADSMFEEELNCL